MPIKLNIDKFNSEMNGHICSFYWSESLKEIEKKLGCIRLKSKTVFQSVPKWYFSSKQQYFAAEIGFDENGLFYSNLTRYPKNIKIETLTEFNNFCIKVIAVLLDKGFILSESEGAEK